MVEDEERGLDPTLPAGLAMAPSESNSVVSGELAFDELGIGGGEAPRGSQIKNCLVNIWVSWS